MSPSGTCQSGTCPDTGTETTLFFSAGPVFFKFFRWSLRHSARSLLVSAAPTSLPLVFSSPPIWLLHCPRHSVFSSIFPSTSNSLADLAGTVFSLFLFYQAAMGPRTLVSPGNDAVVELARRGALLVTTLIPCSLFPFISRIHPHLFSDLRGTVSSKF